MSEECVALTSDLQLLKSLLEMILAELDEEEWDPETVSWSLPDGGLTQVVRILSPPI